MRLLLLAAFLGTAAAAPAQPITGDQLMQHIRVLADDSYEGRAVGTAGGERTEAYVLEAFAAAGLEPGRPGGWRQVVRTVGRTPASTELKFTRQGRAVALPVDSVILTGRDPMVELGALPVIFAGYATDTAMSRLPVRGALVLMLQEQPPGWDGKLSWQDRRQKLFDSGAAVVISIPPANRPWDAVALRGRRTPALSEEAFPQAQGSLSPAAAQALLGPPLKAADSPRFRAIRLPMAVSGKVETTIDRSEPANIVGKIRGTASDGGAIVLMAHWDHTGICRPAGAPDRICNGAVDNASGIAVMIEVARRLAAGPQPKRDIYFLATALEESGGFLGAASFAAEGLIAPQRAIAVLNVDTIAIHPRGLPVAIIGRGRSAALDKVIDDTSRALGRKIDRDDEANVMIERQDGWAFTKLGIPSVMASGSFSNMKRLQDYLAGIYHQPNDDLSQKIELGGAIEDADLHVALLRALADPAIYPTPPAPTP